VRSWRRCRSLAAVGAIGLALAACGGADSGLEPEAAEDAAPIESLAERPCPEDTFVTYEDFGGPFMLTWCNTCHSAALPEGERQEAPVGVDFDTIAQIRTQAERIWLRSGDQNETMPPVGGPDEIDRELLGEWLACGAPSFEDLLPEN
jgi:uncharacterized membrane protein